MNKGMKWLKQLFWPEPKPYITNEILGRDDRCHTAYDLVRSIYLLTGSLESQWMAVSVIMVCGHNVAYRVPITRVEVINGELIIHATRS